MERNKIIYGDKVLIDLSLDDVRAEDVADGKKFHLPSGEVAIGTSKKDADTSDADAIAGDILKDKVAYVQGQKVEGTMPNVGMATGVIDDANVEYHIPVGYHDGTGTVGIDPIEKEKLISSNIKDGINILGVQGSYTGEGVTAQSKSVVPYTDKDQVILPDPGYDFLSQVEVAKISYVETPNSAGGLTVTIGTKSSIV